VLGIGIRGTARDKRYLNPLRYKHHPLKESTAMSESVEERSKEEEGTGTLHTVRRTSGSLIELDTFSGTNNEEESFINKKDRKLE
jgi:hypothetical protein